MSGLLRDSHGPRVRSLRRQLLLWVSLATLLIYTVAAALSYRQARHEVHELMDGQMSTAARLLLVQADSDRKHLAGLADSMAALRGLKSSRSEMTLEFQIARQDGSILSSSQDSPQMKSGNGLGYANLEYNAHPWRSLTLATSDGQYRVQVAQSISLRNKEALEIATKTILPLGVLLPLLIVLIYYSVRRAMKPLDDLASDVATRTSDNLTPLKPATVLKETQPLVSALNQLLKRVATTLDNERRFTADAAHELRTPLAALKIQAQVAMATRDPEQNRDAMAKVIASADRTTRLVEQLLRLARLDPLLQLPDSKPVDLVVLAEAGVNDARTAVSRRSQSLRVEAPETPVTVSGDQDLLASALRNLIDNAIRYTSEGGKVCVRIAVEHGEPLIEVIDNGPGVPPEELSRLVERFYRGRDNTADGSGLGLAIVRRIGELHGARLEVDNVAGGGFSARLRWCYRQ